MRVAPTLVAALTLAAILSGCVSNKDTNGPGGSESNGLVPVNERYLQPYNVTGFFSHTLKAGPYAIGKALSVDVPVTLPPTQGADAATGMAFTNLGLFLPTIDGCDWTKADLPAKCHVPVIADAGPYYRSSTGQDTLEDGSAVVGEGDTVATEPAHRLGKFLIDNFVPQGYAVAQVSVLGTGDSSFCQDLMGLNEQAGLNAAVEWLGTQGWSNGNVALIGRSYDGSTPWEAATFGNPHLKTIVPISGLTGQYELMWRNGSAETRGPGVLYALYAAMTIDGTPEDATQVLCPNYILGAPESGLAYATGGNNALGPHSYWTDRYFYDRAVANYKGSVYVIHGLQDTNVDPHMAVPLLPDMQTHWEVKGMLGQWNHMYPDRPSEHVATPSGYGHEAYPLTVRYDWAQDLLEWFDHYLKGTGPQPVLEIQVQDNHGAWRSESTYPPAATVQELALGKELTMTQGDGTILPNDGTASFPLPLPAGGGPILYEAQPLPTDLRIGGLVRLPLTVTPMGPGGQVYAELQDIDQNGTALHLGHAIMDLRYAAGDGSKMPTPVVPAVAMVAKMEFEALDVQVAAGHHLALLLQATGQDYLPADTPAVVMVGGGTLQLPLVAPSASQFFTPPAWSGDARASAAQP